MRQPTKLGSFEALARATAPDPALSARARELDDDQDEGSIVIWSSVAGGLLFATLGALAVGILVGSSMQPDASDAIEVVNDWNAQYPEAPLEWIIPVVHYVPDTSKPAPTYTPSYNSKRWR